MENEIIPAIIPESFEHLSEQLSMVRDIAPLVQIDIVDGFFAPVTTWPYINKNDLDFKKIIEQEEGMPFWQDFNFEMDLMIQNPEKTIDNWINIGAINLIIHIESTNEIEKIIEKIKNSNIAVGISLNPSTPNEKIYPLIEKINFVQFMGNDKIGHHGVELDERIYEKIKDLRNKYPNLPISVDIGVNRETIQLLVDAGANKLISGSAIFDADNIEEAFEELKNLAIPKT
ncbi:MAG: ribulose-phosphate 3-epimerase [Parcubacteria group bacterium Athens0714_16]|nr:MAG: ribulose-phosphate 3-epimerase [Parcubacteria group bacterium Athens0714_16]